MDVFVVHDTVCGKKDGMGQDRSKSLLNLDTTDLFFFFFFCCCCYYTVDLGCNSKW